MKTEETILIIVVILAVVFLFWGFSGFGINQGGMVNASMMGGMWFFGWIFMILIIIALVLFIVWLTKQIQEK